MERRSVEEAAGAAEFEAREAIEAEGAFVARVRKHAQDHYEQDGWDYVVECWEDREIAQELRDAGGDADQAFQALADGVKLLAERRQDVRAEIF
jgi:hypothetical protein